MHYHPSTKPWKPGEWNWEQEDEAYLKQIAKEVFSKEMLYHPYYS